MYSVHTREYVQNTAQSIMGTDAWSSNVGQPRQKMPSLNKPTPPVGWPIGSHPHCVPRWMQSFSTGGRRLVALTLTLAYWLGLWNGDRQVSVGWCVGSNQSGRQKPTIRSFSQHARQRGPLREATKEATGLDCSPGLRGPQRHLDSFWSAWLHAAPWMVFLSSVFHLYGPISPASCSKMTARAFCEQRAGSRWFKRTDHLPHMKLFHSRLP